MAAVSYYSHWRQTTVTARTLWLLGFVIIYIDITQDRRATQQQVATTTHVSFSFFWWSAPLCGEMERRTVVVSVIVRSPYLPSVVSSYIHTWTDLQLPNRRILCQRELISRCEELACNEVRGTSQGILMLLSQPTQPADLSPQWCLLTVGTQPSSLRVVKADPLYHCNTEAEANRGTRMVRGRMLDWKPSDVQCLCLEHFRAQWTFILQIATISGRSNCSSLAMKANYHFSSIFTWEKRLTDDRMFSHPQHGSAQ